MGHLEPDPPSTENCVIPTLRGDKLTVLHLLKMKTLSVKGIRHPDSEGYDYFELLSEVRQSSCACLEFYHKKELRLQVLMSRLFLFSVVPLR